MIRLLLYCLPLIAFGQKPVFLEPVDKIDTNRAEVGDGIRTYRVVQGSQYEKWMENDSARRAMKLYALAFRILEEAGNPQGQPRDYYIALVQGGNHAAVGFKVQTVGGVEDHAKHAYILLSPDPSRFVDTMLHETGHVAMAMMAGGVQLPRADVSAIPHSTATLSDRATAFSEGYAIHLETLAAHMASDEAGRGRFFHERVVFGSGGNFRQDEYFRHAADLASYSQNLARYTEVRDNHFAFESAYRGPDYLRVQLEKARDFAQLRGPNQLLQSEGFTASFFFLFLMRGESKPGEDVIAARQERMLRAMRAAFGAAKMEADTPWLLHVVEQYMNMFPDERSAVIDAINDLSHGVFVDPAAQALWREHYMAALRLDLKNLKREQIAVERKKWRDQVAENPRVLYSRLGPQLPCEVKGVEIRIVAFGEAGPLVFDINTVQEPVLRMTPGLTSEQRGKWLASRPFQSRDAFRAAIGAGVCAGGTP